MSEATDKQKRYLKALGCKSVAGLSKEDASELIEQLLENERTSGKTFRCPYCKQSFGPRPKSTRKKCPHCANTINHICGKFLTDEQLAAIDQKEWFKDARQEVKVNIGDDWKDEQSFRREFKDKHSVGYILKIGAECLHASHLNGLLVTLEDAKATPDLLPPYDGCRHDSCECEYELVSDHEVPRHTKIAEWSEGPTKPRQLAKKSGCMGVLMVLSVIVLSSAYLVCR